MSGGDKIHWSHIRRWLKQDLDFRMPVHSMNFFFLSLFHINFVFKLVFFRYCTMSPVCSGENCVSFLLLLVLFLFFYELHKAVICNQLVSFASCTILRRHTFQWKHGIFHSSMKVCNFFCFLRLSSFFFAVEQWYWVKGRWMFSLVCYGIITHCVTCWSTFSSAFNVGLRVTKIKTHFIFNQQFFFVSFILEAFLKHFCSYSKQYRKYI